MTETFAQQLLSNPDYRNAKVAILNVLQDLQQSITGPRPPSGDRETHYQELIRRFESIRAGALLFPYLGSGFGRGALVELEDKSFKYDFICGVGVYQFGHCNPDLVDACLDAAVQDVVLQGNAQQNQSSLALSELILEFANRNKKVFDHCFLSSSGVMAGENALKIAFQKKAPANRVLAFRRCFAGRTIAFSHINDKPGTRVGLPDCFPVDHLPYFDPNQPELSTERTLNTLKQYIASYPGKHAALMLELVQGEGGFYAGQSEFFQRVLSICRDAGIAVLVDEIQTFTRLSEPFAYQYYGLEDLIDVVWIGKASQVCATLFRKDFAPQPGLLGQTYTASSSAIAASITILNQLKSGDFFGAEGKIERLSRYTRDRLEAFSHSTGLIRGPYGLGSMIGFTPFDGEVNRVNQFTQELFKNGVISLTAGSQPTRSRFLLPYPVIEEPDLDAALEIVFSTLKSLS